MLKKTKTFIGVIFIGAIGSGFWELFLKDILYIFGKWFINIISLFHNGYIDSLYKNVGRGTHMYFLLPTLAFLVFTILSPLFIYGVLIRRRAIHLSNDKIDTIDKIIKLGRLNFLLKPFVLILASIIISFVYIDLTMECVLTVKSNAILDRNLEIIRPYVTDKKYFELRSYIRQIDNRNKLENCLNEINSIGKTNSIKFEIINLYGITIK